MAIPIAKRGNTPVADALPAIKVRYFSGMPPARQIYCYAKLFATDNALMVSLTAFEREPQENSRIAAALQAAGGQALLVTLGPGGNGGIYPLGAHPLPETPATAESAAPCAAPLPAAPFAGEDEQGWYWGATATLNAGLLLENGIALRDMGSFGLAVYKYDAGGPGYGCSLPGAKGEGAFGPGRFMDCVIAPEGPV